MEIILLGRYVIILEAKPMSNVNPVTINYENEKKIVYRDKLHDVLVNDVLVNAKDCIK